MHFRSMVSYTNCIWAYQICSPGLLSPSPLAPLPVEGGRIVRPYGRTGRKGQGQALPLQGVLVLAAFGRQHQNP